MDSIIHIAQAELHWSNVGLAFSFIALNSVILTFLGLGVGGSLVIAALRCIFQLVLVATLLQQVFSTNNPWAVGGIAFLLNLLGTFEIVTNKSKRRHSHMFPSVLFGLLGSTIPISIIGTKYAMSTDPFWTPIEFIPVVGMLCGSTISAIVVSLSYILKELRENRDKVEMYLAFGASRFEASRPIAVEALRLALTPPINQMSVLGIISIPGMMTGAILGGASVQQAAKLQMIIMFMISAATTLATIFTTMTAISLVIDREHRIRDDRIDDTKPTIWRVRDSIGRAFVGVFKRSAGRARSAPKVDRGSEDERTPLLQ
ncbi:hypothetical protein AX16_005436 [Volvariella volvacea WC 439]|nr:hypothetical protein AX16_005436 [Volvariella volvacea WC 439]